MNIHLFLFILFLPKLAKCTQPSVIIIGGGAAGIAAASRLLQNAINNITILEAEHTLGGRIRSVKFGDAYADLGAQWCHGESGNLVYEMVKDLNLLRRSNLEQKMFYSTGKELTTDFTGTIFKVMEDIYELESNSYSGMDITTGEFFTSRYDSRIKQIFANDSLELKYAEESLQLMDLLICGFEGCFTFYELSVKSSYRYADGDQTLNWNGEGYKVILDVLMKKIPDSSKDLHIEDTTIFNKSVQEIIWSNDSLMVTVRSADGCNYTVDHVIFTPSLGVLKQRHKYLFNERLPQPKEDVIRTLGFGSAMKVFLLFTIPWWPATLGGATFLWSREDRNNIIDKKELTQNLTWILGISYVVTVERNPNVLGVWIGNRTALEVEALEDEEIINGIHVFLTMFMGKVMNVTKPISIIRSNWHSNVNFNGIYSFQTVESQKITSTPSEILQEPLFGVKGKPLVLFAGEATNSIHYSTVHGAIESGYREADRLINFYKVR